MCIRRILLSYHPALKSIVSRRVPSCKRIGFAGAGLYSVDCNLYLNQSDKLSISSCQPHLTEIWWSRESNVCTVCVQICSKSAWESMGLCFASLWRSGPASNASKESRLSDRYLAKELFREIWEVGGQSANVEWTRIYLEMIRTAPLLSTPRDSWKISFPVVHHEVFRRFGLQRVILYLTGWYRKPKERACLCHPEYGNSCQRSLWTKLY